MNSLAMFARRRKATPSMIEQTQGDPDSIPVGTESNPETPITAAGKDEGAKPKPRLSKRRGFSMFTIGSIMGMFVAAFVGVHRDIVSLDALADIRFDALADVIPLVILKEATDISVGLCLS